MFKGHPKGLIVAFFANMGERFGFYTMMAILVLFLQAKFGLDAGNAGLIYSVFYFLIYFLALVGGLLADRVMGLNRTITIGIVTMAVGYLIMSVPGLGLPVTCVGLLIIAFGNGLFKGNLQAVVGNLYEPAEYAHLRDRAFSLFYMGINIGAIFAPTAAVSIRNWFIGTKGFLYDGQLPGMAHSLLKGGEVTPDFLSRASAVMIDHTTVTADTAVQFAHNYIDSFSVGYNYAFGIAACAMLISLLTYMIFKKDLLPGMSLNMVGKGADNTSMPKITPEQTRQRIIALILVFLVVIFFWMSFHQNGLTLTFYARDYTQLNGISPGTNFLFDLWAMLPVVVTLFSLAYAFTGTGKTVLKRGLGMSVAIAAAYLAYLRISGYSSGNTISAEIFQQFNPIFVVLLTPVAIGFFAFLSKRNMEPSAPRKIGIGMIIASLAFVLLLVASLGQLLPKGLDGAANTDLSTPYLLIGTYFILTIAELFLSPMGISFVSKVAPPKYKGLMQGGWLCATALGNQLLFVGSTMWLKFTHVWQVWSIFVVCCLISAAVIFLLMKRLEKVAQ